MKCIFIFLTGYLLLCMQAGSYPQPSGKLYLSWWLISDGGQFRMQWGSYHISGELPWKLHPAPITIQSHQMKKFAHTTPNTPQGQTTHCLVPFSFLFFIYMYLMFQQSLLALFLICVMHLRVKCITCSKFQNHLMFSFWFECHLLPFTFTIFITQLNHQLQSD